MTDKNKTAAIGEGKKQWEEEVVEPALERFKLEENPSKFYTPADIEGFDFLEKVGFPGSYPFTAGPYPVNPYAAGTRGGGAIQSAPGLRRAGRYSGYGTAEDTRDYYKQMAQMGSRSGPNLAMDLPTQCGYDSDNPMVRGEIGKTGVAVDSLEDFEILYEAFRGPSDLDKTASNFTINAPASVIVSMYLALADKRGISYDQLRGTPQNDILKEYVARGTYIFPPKHAMRLFRDSAVFMAKHVPKMNINSIGGYHIREAGATREQDLAFSMAIGIAYLSEGVNAGLDIDELASRVTFNAFGGSMELLKEVAFQRAARRMWATILKERFNAKQAKSMLIRMPLGAHIGACSTTAQRPLNNLTRAVVSGIASAFSGFSPNVYPPFDEPLGLGWSLEAIQLSEDGSRILQHEAKVVEVMDPFAGSYYMENLTDQIEADAWAELKKIEDMGGAVAAIENGYMQKQIAHSAHEKQRKLETGEEKLVGVNCYTDEYELDVQVQRMVQHPYDSQKREQAEKSQIARLQELKRKRDSEAVRRSLKDLKQAAENESTNLMPYIIDCVKVYSTEQEICDVLRDVFGEYEAPSFL